MCNEPHTQMDFGYLDRPPYPPSQILKNWIKRQILKGFRKESDLVSGAWISPGIHTSSANIHTSPANIHASSANIHTSSANIHTCLADIHTCLACIPPARRRTGTLILLTGVPHSSPSSSRCPWPLSRTFLYPLLSNLTWRQFESTSGAYVC